LLIVGNAFFKALDIFFTWDNFLKILGSLAFFGIVSYLIFVAELADHSNIISNILYLSNYYYLMNSRCNLVISLYNILTASNPKVLEKLLTYSFLSFFEAISCNLLIRLIKNLIPLIKGIILIGGGGNSGSAGGGGSAGGVSAGGGPPGDPGGMGPPMIIPGSAYPHSRRRKRENDEYSHLSTFQQAQRRRINLNKKYPPKDSPFRATGTFLLKRKKVLESHGYKADS
jgi:hypothetical protein